jgi:hypothetical protein
MSNDSLFALAGEFGCAPARFARIAVACALAAVPWPPSSQHLGAAGPSAHDVHAIGSQSAEIPSRRSAYSMAYDARRHRVVLYGGSDSAFTRLSDTWEWDGKNWRQIM